MKTPQHDSLEPRVKTHSLVGLFIFSWNTTHNFIVLVIWFKAKRIVTTVTFIINAIYGRKILYNSCNGIINRRELHVCIP